MKSSYRPDVVTLALIAGLVAFVISSGEALAQIQRELSYAAKIVCNQRTNDIVQVLRGEYGTVINIHNPHDVSVRFFKKAVKAHPQRWNPSLISNYVEEVLPPDAAVGVDCTDVRRLFNPQIPGFFDGFLVIRVPVDKDLGITPELDVVAVYTAKQLDQDDTTDVRTIDIERVEPKIVITKAGPQLPDLTIRLVNPPTGVSCPGGQGTCIHDVDLEVVENNGLAVAGMFQVDVFTDSGLATTINVPGIAASGVLPYTVTLGPGNNCYNPDCQVTAVVDSGSTVTETNEANNSDSRLDQG